MDQPGTCDPHPLEGKCVLMAGMDSAVFLEPLAKSIKAVEPQICLATAGLTDPDPGSGSKRQGAFDVYYPDLEGTRAGGDAGWQEVLGHRSLFPVEVFRRRMRRILNMNRRARTIRSISTNFDRIRDKVDMLHVHGLFIGPLHRWLLKQRQLPFVVSCWGSDVLRSDWLPTIGIQQEVLRKASAITVTTPELKELVLAKYGRDLERKICNAYFPPDVEAVAVGDRNRAMEAFRRRHQIGDSKIIVTIGHSADAGGEHLTFLRSLELLGPAVLDRVFVSLPMTYGGTPAYLNEVRKLLASMRCDGAVIDHYLSNDLMEELRLATDVFIYGPVSDSFSGTVSQALAAGSVTLLGSWLPYTLRRRAGFQYWEFDTRAEAGRLLTDMLERWPAPLREAESNRNLSLEFFAPDKIGRDWIRAYAFSLKNHRILN